MNLYLTESYNFVNRTWEIYGIARNLRAARKQMTDMRYEGRERTRLTKYTRARRRSKR